MNPLDWLSLPTALFMGLGITFAVVFTRAIPWPRELLRRKPFSCDACMVGWLLIVTAAGLAPKMTVGWLLWHIPAAGGFALLFVALQAKWRGEADQARGWNDGQSVAPQTTSPPSP